MDSLGKNKWILSLQPVKLRGVHDTEIRLFLYDDAKNPQWVCTISCACMVEHTI